jgi:hypothetical protein
MLQRFLVLVLVLCGAAQARADDAVECAQSRDGCDGKILKLCPAGAEVLEEQPLSDGGFRIVFRCRGEQSAAPTVSASPAQAPAPSPLEAPAAPTSTPVAPAPSASSGPLVAQPAASPEYELQNVHLRLAELKAGRRQHSVTGPVIMMGAGSVAMTVLALLAVSSKQEADDIESGDAFDPTPFIEDDQARADDARWSARFLGGLSIVSAGVAAGGTLWLVRRVKARGKFRTEIERLQTRQRELRDQLTLGLAVDPASRGLVLHGRF